MPFDPNGRFLPATALNVQSPAQMQNRTISMAQPQAQTAMAFRPQTSMLARTYSGGEFPQLNDRAMLQNRAAYTAFAPQFRFPTTPDPNPPRQAQPQPPPVVNDRPNFNPNELQAIRPTVGPQGVQTYGMSQLGAAAPQQMPQQGPSPTQMAGRGNAQSVSNYLQALHQNGQASNNANMNYAGQLGAGPQGGFRGFGYNPGYGPDFVQNSYMGMVGPQGAGAVYNPNVSYQNNGAYTNQNYNVGNYAQQGAYGRAAAPRSYGGDVTAGGTGGVAGQPQFEIPKPWGNPADPAQNQAVWDSMSSDEKSAYLGAPRSGGFLESTPPQSYNWPSQQGSFYSTSDERAKENIAPAQKELEEFMDALGIYSYEYKDKADGEGRYISPMAQEFERSQLGAQAVVETPEGKKMVNYGRLAGVQTAALALLNHKYNSLEQKFNEAMKTNLKNRKK